MTAIVLIESPLMIVQRDQSLAQSTVLKIVLFDLRFHPMALAAQLMTELLAYLLPMHVHHPLQMLNVLNLLKREYLNSQLLLSKTVSASLGFQEWKTVSTPNRVWRSACQMHPSSVLIDLFRMTVLLVLALWTHHVYCL